MIAIPYAWNNDNSQNEKSDAKTKLIEYANEVTLSENIKSFKFEPTTVAGLSNKANLVIAVLGFVPIGTVVTFSFLGSSITLEASETPTSGQFITYATAPININEYRELVAESIVDALINVLTFKENYDSSVAGSNISILAKDNGGEFDISAVSSFAGIFIQSVAGSAEFETQNVIDYLCFVDLYVGNQTFSQNVDKFSAFKIDEYLIDTLKDKASITASPVGDWVQPIKPEKQTAKSSDFFKIDSGETGAGLVLPTDEDGGQNRFHLRPYFLVYGDSFRFVENGQRKKFTKGVTPVRWVQLGAYDKIRPYDMNEYILNPNSLNSFNWLTSCPNEKVVTYQSHEFLQLICRKPSQSTNAKIRYKLNYYDGTFEFLENSDFDTLDISGNVSFDVSPVALGLENHELITGKLIKSYEVFLQWDYASSTAISEIKTFVFDRVCYDQQHQIIFLNEFGAWDSLNFTGAKQSSIDREVNTIQRVLPNDANSINAINKEVSININTSVLDNKSLHTGLIGYKHQSWAKQILKSSAVYIWNDEFLKYESILINDYNYRPDTKEESGNLSISYTRTVDENTIKR